jgi:hypothetical protein
MNINFNNIVNFNFNFKNDKFKIFFNNYIIIFEEENSFYIILKRNRVFLLEEGMYNIGYIKKIKLENYRKRKN